MSAHDPDDAPVQVHVRRGDPSPEELAAAIAVLTEAYTAEIDAAVYDEGARPSAWSQRRRGLREPLRREIPWGRFSA